MENQGMNNTRRLWRARLSFGLTCLPGCRGASKQAQIHRKCQGTHRDVAPRAVSVPCFAAGTNGNTKGWNWRL